MRPVERKFAAVLAGSLLVAVGLNLFFVPYELMDGGLIGVALILNYLWRVKVGLAVILLSLPIFVWAWRRNRTFFYNSLHGMMISSLLIDIVASFYKKILLPTYGPVSFHPLVSAIGGGLLVGTGIGLMLRHRISTGGTDLVAQFISEVTRVNVGMIILLMDVLVLLAGGLLLTEDTLLLSTIAILAVALSTSLMVAVPEGPEGAGG